MTSVLSLLSSTFWFRWSRYPCRLARKLSSKSSVRGRHGNLVFLTASLLLKNLCLRLAIRLAHSATVLSFGILTHSPFERFLISLSCVTPTLATLPHVNALFYIPPESEASHWSRQQNSTSTCVPKRGTGTWPLVV